ncbi:MAG: hypothetical protein IJH65_05430 [Methanobrevibacter sp.]|nr:hypothetical protein [Methanobrevibacter sp.]
MLKAPAEYIIKDSTWDQLKQYMFDNKNKYGLQNISLEEDQVFLYKLHELSQKNLGYNEDDHIAINHGANNLENGNATTFRRYSRNYNFDNLYRICFTLGLDLKESEILFNEYLHVNQLSARSLKEFIVSWALYRRIPWSQTRNLLTKYDSEIKRQPQSPEDLYGGTGTDEFQDDSFKNIKTINDFNNFMAITDNIAFFSRLRNTHYNALFEDRAQTSQGKRRKHYVLHDEDWNEITMRSWYDRLFGLHPLGYPTDHEEGEPYLEDNEIKTLISIFDEAFITYSQFCNIVQRRLIGEPCQEIYLLHIVERLEDEEYSSFDSFVDNCNSSLEGAGFPILNDNYRFNMLIMDVYDQAQHDYGDVTKCLYLSGLRSALRLIIAEYNKTNN